MRLNKLPFTVLKTINTYNLIKPHDSVIVAVSGGPDSVALLKIFHTLHVTQNLPLRIYVAHLDHQLRGKSSEQDAQFVQDLSKNLSLPFFSKSVNIRQISDQTKGSIEEIARRERYKFLTELSLQHNAASVAVGHNADDNTETILHRIIRGTGLLGLGGIPIQRPLLENPPVQLIRPLLFIWRREIVAYLEKEQVDYRTDMSNYETVYLRNKIRLELIPWLEEQFNPNIRNNLIQLCRILTANNEYLSSEAQKVLTIATRESAKNSYSINTRFLMNQPRILQYLVIQKVLNIMEVPLKEITYGHYTKILDEVCRAGRGRHFQMPGKLSLWHEHGILYFTRELFQPQQSFIAETPIQIPGVTPVSPFGEVIAEIIDIRKFSLEAYKKSKAKYEEVFDFECVKMPLTVRLRKKGDTISPLGLRGYKKLKDLFIDKKIPIRERNSIPIVTMRDQPIWVAGICIDNRVKVTPDTRRILKLTFKI